MSDAQDIVGPILLLDDIAGDRMQIAALFIVHGDAVPPPVCTDDVEVTPQKLASAGGITAFRARFDLPADRTSSYSWRGETFEVAGDLTGDLRLGYVSCNGEESGDLDRPADERNAVWARLCKEHRDAPFGLLLHGGDQIYADEATHGHPLSHDWPDRVPKTPSPADLDDLRTHLRAQFWQRYAAIYSLPEFSWIAARVPSLMQWDDHDICDGWGSLLPDATGSDVGQVLFSAAREACLVFQHAALDDDLPPRFRDPDGQHIGWSVSGPSFRIVAPDLRSQRTRRQVMDEAGWKMMEEEAEAPFSGQTLLMSSVPLLGPRLSLIEAMMGLIPKMQEYEDDLRDQWQSRAHRASWQRMLKLVLRMTEAGDQTVCCVSGEIHLATRATMDLSEGRKLHQLVASGIAHRAPPKAWARTLGLLASLGEDPLPKHPIRIQPLPGQSTRYVADRNFLTIARKDGAWSARWFLEQTGMTPELKI